MDYDTVIIGAGSAGCVLANRLSADGRPVLLLEAGPDYNGDPPADITDGTRIAGSHDWGYTDTAGRQLPRGRIVGGSSAVNACFALPGHPADYSWGPGWSWSEVEPAFRALASELPIRRYDQLTPLHARFLRCTPTAVRLPVTCVDGRRISAATAFLDPVRHRPNLTVRPDVVVDRVLVDDERGVLLVGGEFIAAERIVLAAGAYGSPPILLRSGIPCGDGLTDHVGVSVDFPVPADWPTAPQFQTLLTLHSSDADPEGPPDLQIFPGGAWPMDSSPTGRVASLCVALMKPRSRGHIRLRDSDPLSPPVIDLAHLSDPLDRERLSDGVRQAEKIAYAMAGVEATADLDDPWTYHHPVGSCGMGRVVDFDGKVIGADGLYVADASVMPEIPGANTNLPTMMLAHLLASRWSS